MSGRRGPQMHPGRSCGSVRNLCQGTATPTLAVHRDVRVAWRRRGRAWLEEAGSRGKKLRGGNWMKK